jgi:hypothetical protein
MMRTGARLHNDGTGMERREEFDQLLAVHLFTEHSLAFRVLPMQVKAVFAQIDTNERYVVHDGLQFRMNTASLTCPARLGWTIPLVEVSKQPPDRGERPS